MQGIWDKILSEAGLAGAFIGVLLFACWKLYRDLVKAKDILYRELKEAKERQEEKYRTAIREMTDSFEHLSRIMDKFFDLLMRRR